MRSALLHGSGPGPGALPMGPGPTLPAWALASMRAHTQSGVRACRPSASFLPTSGPCCAGALPCAGPCGAARPPPPVPVRPTRPSGPLGPPRARAPPLRPRLSRSGACAPLSRLRGLSLAPSAFGPGLPVRRPSCSGGLAPGGLGPCAARGPGASSRVGPFGLRPGLAPARAVARPGAALGWPFRPGRRPAAAFLRRGFLPGLPPAPAAPSGGSRGARGCALGTPAPAPPARPLSSGCFRSYARFLSLARFTRHPSTAAFTPSRVK